MTRQPEFFKQYWNIVKVPKAFGVTGYVGSVNIASNAYMLHARVFDFHQIKIAKCRYGLITID